MGYRLAFTHGTKYRGQPETQVIPPALLCRWNLDVVIERLLHARQAQHDERVKGRAIVDLVPIVTLLVRQ
jgi:hypothetical protein